MIQEQFAIALSEKNQEEAIKEVSLKIKLIFPKQIGHLITLFTPHYHPKNILESINLTLRPKNILGIESPFIIFENRLIQKGIICCCINNKNMRINSSIIETGSLEKIASSIRASIKGQKKQDSFIFSFLSHQINPSDYINAMRLSLGSFFNLFGSGYANKYLSSNYQILGNTIHQGLTNFSIKGVEIFSVKLNGYLPIGKPFTITKAIPDKNILIEINHQPAINIYKNYLGEKFDLFLKNHLFSFYPLGIKEHGSRRLLNIVDFLEDGSLICMGKVNENVDGNIMLFDTSFLINDLEKALSPIRKKSHGLVIIINSLSRKNILKDLAIEEIELIKNILGGNFGIIGLFSDYSIFSEAREGHTTLEAGTSLITLWQ